MFFFEMLNWKIWLYYLVVIKCRKQEYHVTNYFPKLINFHQRKVIIKTFTWKKNKSSMFERVNYFRSINYRLLWIFFPKKTCLKFLESNSSFDATLTLGATHSVDSNIFSAQSIAQLQKILEINYAQTISQHFKQQTKGKNEWLNVHWQ